MEKNEHPVIYRGSVKNIRVAKQPKASTPGKYIFEFTDDYSVFDYGKMPDAIRGKGAAIAMMSACIFEELENPQAWKKLFRKPDIWETLGGKAFRDRLRRSAAGKKLASRGLQTHYIGLLDRQGRCRSSAQLKEPSSRLLVKAVHVVTPLPVSMDGNVVWDYTPFFPGLPQYLIPLENVFRFGVPKGSSLFGRLKRIPGYGKQLGLDKPPREGEWLPRPVLEFFSKLEPMDRYLPMESALNFSGLPGKDFHTLRDLSLLVAVFLYNLFLSRGLDLWDGKFEFVKVGEEILLADSITPDELRITSKGTQLSKEPLRQYYVKNDPKFVRAMKEVKGKGLSSSTAIRKEVKKSLKRTPMKLDPGFLKIMEQMYQALTFRITGSELFSGAMDLDEVVAELRRG